MTARVVLDPEETAPSHPKRVYRELVRSLTYPDDPGHGLEPLLERAARNDRVIDELCVAERVRAREALEDGAHLYLTPALRYYRALALGERNGRKLEDAPGDEAIDYGLRLLVGWLEGHPTISNTVIDDDLRHLVGRQGRIYSLMDYRPWARIYGYLLSGLSTLIRRVGYRGLVVLIDEAEFYALLSSQNREYARILFKALSWASVGGDGLVPFSRKALDLGGMGILKELPPRYGDDGGLYTVFAMTPDTDGVAALSGAVPEDDIVELSRLDIEDYRELASRVVAHYRNARPDGEIAEPLERALGKVVAGLLSSGYIEQPRQAMKFVVEFLDLANFRPAQMKQVVEDLRAMYGGI